MRERISNKMMEKENFNVVDIFGENVFNDSVMQARLPKKVYKKLHEVMEEGKELDLETADVVAHEMKEWAIEKGATHYTHWFQNNSLLRICSSRSSSVRLRRITFSMRKLAAP